MAMTLLSLLGGLLILKSAVATIGAADDCSEERRFFAHLIIAIDITWFIKAGIKMKSKCIMNPFVPVEPEWKIYYNLTTNQTIDIIDSNNPRVSFYKHQQQRILRIGFGPIPCSCQGLTCGCCSGINIQYYNFNKKACMNFTYDPYEFELLINMLMDDDSLFMQSISGKNPPPACIPFSMPLLPQVNFCLKFFNIHTPGYNIFMCIDFETRIQSTPILILHFDCMQMGADGIQYHKPEDAEILPVEAPNESNQQGPEIYDEVFEEEENKTSTAKPKQALIQNTEKIMEKDEAYDEIC